MRELALIWAGALVLMVALWLVQRRRQDASLVDAGWSGGIGLGGLTLLALGSGDPLRRGVFAVMVACWSGRLTAYLVRDRLIGKPEDGRYAMLRSSWGAQAQRNFFWFFQAQALLVAIFTVPAWVVANAPGAFARWFDIAGLALWVVGSVIEAVADRELARWRKNPASHGRTCRSGLWRYSRHPNYFGEWLLWCGFALVGAGSPWFAAAAAVPLLLLGLLLWVTGIPYTERRALVSRGDDYRRYQRATSAFIPWIPRAEDPAPDQANRAPT